MRVTELHRGWKNEPTHERIRAVLTVEPFRGTHASRVLTSASRRRFRKSGETPLRACETQALPGRLPRSSHCSAFTLAEVLAALALMAIIIPVAMHGVQIASRAGILGERKTTAMRVAERVLSEQLVTGNLIQTTASGSIVENGATYPWTLKSETWSEDAMSVATVQVTFTVQGNEYSVSASTLYDPTLSSSGSSTTMTSSTRTP